MFATNGHGLASRAAFAATTRRRPFDAASAAAAVAAGVHLCHSAVLHVSRPLRQCRLQRHAGAWIIRNSTEDCANANVIEPILPDHCLDASCCRRCAQHESTTNVPATAFTISISIIVVVVILIISNLLASSSIDITIRIPLNATASAKPAGLRRQRRRPTTTTTTSHIAQPFASIPEDVPPPAAGADRGRP